MLYSLVCASESAGLGAPLMARKAGAGLASRLRAGLAFIDRRGFGAYVLLPTSGAKGFVTTLVH